MICETALEGLPSWGPDGTILFARSLDGIYRVPASGGAATQVTKVESSRREVSHLWPHFLPDGRHFIYVSIRRAPDAPNLIRAIHVATPDGRDRPGAADGGLASGVRGARVFAVQCAKGVLLAQAFDASTLELATETVSLVEGLHYFMSTANAGFSVSQTGVLAYHARNGNVEARLVRSQRKRSRCAGRPCCLRWPATRAGREAGCR